MFHGPWLIRDLYVETCFLQIKRGAGETKQNQYCSEVQTKEWDKKISFW